MKVLQIINSLATGGAEKLLLETIPLYQKEGVKMDVLVLNGTEYPFMKELKALNCCNIYSLGSKSVYNPMHVFKIMPYLKKYDLVHVHLFPAQYWVILAKILSFSRVKLIFTEHNTSNRRLEKQLFSKIDKNSYKFYSAVVCISQEIKDILLEHTKLPSSKFYLIGNGINLSIINKVIPIHKNEIHPSLNLEDTVLIQVAGFREQKDQATLIKAMTFLSDTIKLILVGDGLLKTKNEELVKELGLQERVLFLGLRMDVPRLLKAADIVVLSSKYEGLSLSSIEGMASGKPFVASNVPGLSEVVQGAGVLFPVGDEVQLAKEISLLIENPEHYKKIVDSCQKRASEYDIKRMIDQHLQMYQEVYEA